MIIFILILIYLISFAIHILLEYKENKRFIHNIGDLIDNIELFMWFPLINTSTLIVVVIGIFIKNLCELLKLDILWKKFRNIRLN
jgi:hypothetical protein